MLIMNVYGLKIWFYLLFLFTLLIGFGVTNVVELQETDHRLSTSNTIYKKILKMRTLPFEDCGSTYDILYLSISSCSTIPCEMQRGTKVVVNVIFDDYGKNTSFLKHHVSWIFNAIRSDAVITPDPCDGDHQCLVNNSDGKTYYSTVFVNNNFACIRGTMLWEAFDHNGTKVLCFRIPVVITE